jgi:hypothetical protein
MKRKITLLTLLSLALAQTGCGLLIGKVKPVDEKSDFYGVMDLAKEKPQEWTRLDPSQVDGGGEPDKEHNSASSEISDAVYQSRKTASTISINSACRPPSPNGDDKQDLRSVTNLLFLGLSDITLRSERGIDVQGSTGLETTVRGKLSVSPRSGSKEEVTLRTVVVKKNGCVYDLVYLAPPSHFQTNLNDFTQFVASLRLR